MTDQTDPTGKTFEARIRGLLELLGYHVQHDRLVAGRQTDLVAVKDVFPGRVLYLVECKDYSQRVGVDVIRDADSRVRAAQAGKYPDAQGWVVARSGFTADAWDFAEPLGIVCSTPDDLIRSLIDFTSYLNNLIHDFQDLLVDRERGLKLPQLYVEPDAFYYPRELELPPEAMNLLTEVGPLQTLVDEWLADPELNQLTLLGDYGTGKTVFTLKLAHDLAQAYLDGQGTLIPVRIPLKEFDPKQEVADLVMNHLRRHGIEGSPYAAFQYLLRQGMLLLILDGFDEITAQVATGLRWRRCWSAGRACPRWEPGRGRTSTRPSSAGPITTSSTCASSTSPRSPRTCKKRATIRGRGTERPSDASTIWRTWCGGRYCWTWWSRACPPYGSGRVR
jgi:hypothetical protein